MPMFEYVCQTCNVVFERLVDHVDQADDQRHDHCGQPAVRRPSSPAFTVAGYNAKNGYSARGRA